MHTSRLSFVLGAWLTLFASSDRVPLPHSAHPADPTNRATHSAASYLNLPLSFEPNRGQVQGPVEFFSRSRGFSLYLTPAEATFTLRAGKAEQALSPSAAGVGPRGTEGVAREIAMVRLRLVGSRGDAKAEALDSLPGQSHYLIGNDPARWQTGVPHYARVRYRGVYPGIDVVYHGDDSSQLEYDFVVAPGSDPAAIRLQIEGANDVRLTEKGELALSTPAGELRQKKPVAYQEVDGERKTVAAQFSLHTDGTLQFQVAHHDRSRPLVIDPVIQYATYFGGTGDDSANSVAIDRQGNAYIAGTTDSIDLPLANAVIPTLPGRHAFVTKFAASGGELVYSTYIGGATGWEEGTDVDVDTRGRAYLTGSTTSRDFPVVKAYRATLSGSDDVFVSVLSPDGKTFVYSSYLGGFDSESASTIAVDPVGKVLVGGYTTSRDFPVMNPVQAEPGGFLDGFVSRLDLEGGLAFSTLLGGEGRDIIEGIARDREGNILASGVTDSRDFPIVNAVQPSLNGGQDVFVVKIDAATSRISFSTYLGGRETENSCGLTLDPTGNVYVAGASESQDFPTTPGAFATHCATSQASECFDAFATKLAKDGSAILFSTYLGGGSIDFAEGIAVDEAGVMITGNTTSRDFPLASAFYGPQDLSSQATFLAQLDATGARLLFSTYLSGRLTGEDRANALALDHFGNAYVTGETSSDAFPTFRAFQPRYASPPFARDAFLAKVNLKRDDVNPRVAFVDFTFPYNWYYSETGWVPDPESPPVPEFERLSFCQKWYPGTTAVLPYRIESIGSDLSGGPRFNVQSYVCIDETPRIAFWPGKVNQHFSDMKWQTDPNGFSGANVDPVQYCNKWFKGTTQVADHRRETIFDWKEARNRNSHVGTTMTLRCIP